MRKGISAIIHGKKKEPKRQTSTLSLFKQGMILLAEFRLCYNLQHKNNSVKPFLFSFP